MSLWEIEERSARSNESGYRRAVQQTLAYVARFVDMPEPTHHEIELLQRRAGLMRFDKKPHPLLLDELFGTFSPSDNAADAAGDE